MTSTASRERTGMNLCQEPGCIRSGHLRGTSYVQYIVANRNWSHHNETDVAASDLAQMMWFLVIAYSASLVINLWHKDTDVKTHTVPIIHLSIAGACVRVLMIHRRPHRWRYHVLERKRVLHPPSVLQNQGCHRGCLVALVPD